MQNYKKTATGTGTITDDKGPNNPMNEDVKANIEVSDAGSVKKQMETLTYSSKTIKRSWIKCKKK